MSISRNAISNYYTLEMLEELKIGSVTDESFDLRGKHLLFDLTYYEVTGCVCAVMYPVPEEFRDDIGEFTDLVFTLNNGVVTAKIGRGDEWGDSNFNNFTYEYFVIDGTEYVYLHLPNIPEFENSGFIHCDFKRSWFLSGPIVKPEIADKLTLIAKNQQRVYDKGFENGQKASGGGSYEQGFTDGKQSEYDKFWDNYQEYGNRKEYSLAFGGSGWTEQTFKPKYNINPSNAYMMFRGAALEIDLVEHLKNLAVELDFSKSENTQYLFNSSAFTRIGVVNVSGSSNSTPLDNTFGSCSKLVTIDKIVLKTGNVSEVNNGTFLNCNALENVVFEGVISKNGLNLRHSIKLSKASIESVINALSTTTSGLAVTLSLTAVNKAFETSEGTNDGSNSTEWQTLVNTKTNWTINLS